jgi:ssDNA-binding Zn-finger/Zn-ribbon topoisomerase 1
MTKPAKIYRLACPECGADMNLRPSNFGQKFWYSCSRWPRCRGSHGAHPTGKPLGIPANKEVKELRHKAHVLFDPIYMIYPKGKERERARWRAYQWMAYWMNLPMDQAHIGMFNKEQCLKLIDLLNNELYIECYEIAAHEPLYNFSQSEKKLFQYRDRRKAKEL